MSAWHDRLELYRQLRRGGATRRSLLLFPIRRRLLRPRNLLELTSGERFETSRDEQLVPMFDEIWLRESYLPAGWTRESVVTVIDVGANVGVFTIWAARRLGATRIVAIEPAPDTAAALMANLVRNNVDATLLQVALGARRRDAMLYRRAPHASWDTLRTSDLSGSTFKPLVSSPVINLDDVFSLLRIERCDLLKLDCEGAEYEILRGASQECLQRVRYIAGEYHAGMDEGNAGDFERLLTRAGFTIRWFPPLDPEGRHFHAARPAE